MSVTNVPGPLVQRGSTCGNSLRLFKAPFQPPPGAQPSPRIILQLLPIVNAYEVNAEPGTYNITGQAATLVKTSILVATAGAYTLTGAAATITKGFFTLAAPGTYTLTGAAATLIAARSQVATAGVYNVTGVAASTLKGFFALAAPGAYTLTGVAASTLKGFFALAVPGVYTITGAAATLTATRSLTASVGAYALTGAAATISRSFSLSLDAGALILTGAVADITKAGVAATVRASGFVRRPFARVITRRRARLMVTSDVELGVRAELIATVRAQPRVGLMVLAVLGEARLTTSVVPQNRRQIAFHAGLSWVPRVRGELVINAQRADHWLCAALGLVGVEDLR